MLANVLVLELFWSVDIQVAYYSEKTMQMTRRCTDNVTVTDYRFLFLILNICHSVCAIHACIVFGRVEKPSGKVET